MGTNVNCLFFYFHEIAMHVEKDLQQTTKEELMLWCVLEHICFVEHICSVLPEYITANRACISKEIISKYRDL